MKTIAETQRAFLSNLEFLLEQLFIYFEGKPMNSYFLKSTENYLASIDPLNELEYE